MSDSLFASGGCRCGKVTLEIAAAPRMMAQCHCSDCQKATGSGHASLAFFEQQDVTIQGDTRGHAVTTDSGNEATRYFCPDCGSRLYGLNSSRPTMISVPVGCMDDHSWFTPGAVVYTKRRQDWDTTPADIPNFEEMPPPPPES